RAWCSKDDDGLATMGRRARWTVCAALRVTTTSSTAASPDDPAPPSVEGSHFPGVDVGRLVPLALKATAQALQEFPELNARLERDEIVYLERYDLGIAVQTDGGLVVPVVRGCDSRSLEELEADVERLADAAREGPLA